MAILTRDIHEDLDGMARELGNARAECRTKGGLPSVSRALDAAIEYAASARARAEGQSELERHRLVKRIRKVLGYTYP